MVPQKQHGFFHLLPLTTMTRVISLPLFRCIYMGHCLATSIAPFYNNYAGLPSSILITVIAEVRNYTGKVKVKY